MTDVLIRRGDLDYTPRRETSGELSIDDTLILNLSFQDYEEMSFC
jgi:hypothetical protein